jgi:DNA-binding NarL/FixJ family response regulator
MAIRVILADDHPLVVLAVGSVLDGTEFEVVADAQDGRQVLPLVQRLRPDLLLLDLALPGISGQHLLVRLARQHPDVSVVVFSGSEEPEYIQLALRLGARAYIVKSCAIETLPMLLREVTTGHVYRAPAGWAEDARQNVADAAGLTARELVILGLVAEGHTNPQIAGRLWLSRETVKSHLSNIYRKLGVANRAQATRTARELHLLELGGAFANGIGHSGAGTVG